tara:strand:+ start:3053 stop:5464 length:2412 start_codon:yes stop_codon:yes gene_type:complete
MKQVNYKINVTTGNSDKNIKKTEKNIKGLGKDVKDVNKSSTNLNDSFAVMPGSIGRVVQSFKALKLAMLSSGIGAVVVGVGALAGLFAAATAKGAEFAKAMSGLKAVTGATDAEIQALAHTAKELGSSTEFTAMQVAELQTELAKLGFSTSQINDMSEATLNLASSMGVSLGEAAAFTGSTLRAFGLQAKDSKEVIDILAQSTSSSALDFSKLNTALTTVAPIAKTANVSLTDTTAMLGTLANAGFDASTSGTALRNILLTLSEEGLTMEEAFTKINNATDKNIVALDLFDKRGAGVAITLAENIEKTAQLKEELDGATESFDGLGAAAGIAETRLDNLQGDTTKLKSAWEGFLLSIEDGDGVFNIAVRGLVQYWTTILNAITTANAFVGAFFAELGASFEPINKFRLFVREAIDNISLAFFKLQGVIADTPIIGKAIDKQNLENNLKEVRASLKQINEEQAYWSEQAEKRQEKGTFMDRVRMRLKEAEAKKLEEQLSQIQEEGLETRDEASEEATAKELARLKKLAEERAKLERKRIQNIAKLEGELLAEVEKFDELARQRKQTDQQNEIDAVNEKYFKLINDTRLGEEEILRLKIQLKEEEAIINEKFRKKEEEANRKARFDDLNQRLDLASQAANSVQAIGDAVFAHKMKNLEQGSAEEETMARKQFKFNKALQLGMAIIDSGKAITASLAQSPIAIGPVPNPAGIASLAFAAATSAANIATIAAQQFQGGASTSPSSVSGAGAIGSQAPDFNVVGQSGFNQVAQALGEQNNTPVQAYVVSGNVTTAQALENNIIETATF